MSRPLVSIVISTHNRCRYATHCVDSLLDLSDKRLEVIVTDTSDVSDLETFIATRRQSKSPVTLVYRRLAENLTMAGNYEQGINLASGEYVCLIGDDDTVLPSILEAAAWGRKHQIDLISQRLSANYAWPDFRTKAVGSRHGGRVYFDRKFTVAKELDTAVGVAGALAEAGQGTELLPRVYHGLISRSALNRMKEQSGRYVHGPVPDVSLALGAAVTNSTFVEVGFPITLPGASGGSNSGRVGMNIQRGQLSDDRMTTDYSFEGISAAIPAVFSTETIWAQAAIETLKHRAPNLTKHFNFPRLYALMAIHHPDFSDALVEARDNLTRLAGSDVDLAKEERGQRRVIRIKGIQTLLKRAMHPTVAGGRRYVPNNETIRDAQGSLQRELSNRSLRFTDYLP